MKKIILALTVFLMAAGAVFAQSDLQPLVIVKYNKSETITVKQLKIFRNFLFIKGDHRAE